MTRAALLALCALSLAGCEFARTSVPYAPAPGAVSDDWDLARLACASDGGVLVEQYQWAVVRRESALRCERSSER